MKTWLVQGTIDYRVSAETEDEAVRLVKERAITLTKDPIFPTLAIHELLGRRPDGEPSELVTTDLLWNLVRLHEPKVIVEAGTYQGHGALACAAALAADSLDGHVWTCDINVSTVMDSAKQLGLDSYVTFFRGDFPEMLATITPQVDFAYLDAGPDNDGLRWRHFQAVRPRLAEGALVVCDDVAGQWLGAADFRALGTYFPKHRGLALWQRR
jgi:predicted O-methyltransferase YrrM